MSFLNGIIKVQGLGSARPFPVTPHSPFSNTDPISSVLVRRLMCVIARQ